MKKESKNKARVNNDMLQAPLGTLKEKEIDILLYILYIIKDKGTETIVVPFSFFTRISPGTSRLTGDELVEFIDSMREKLQKFVVKYEDENGTNWRDVIFPRIGINKEKRELHIEVSESFAYIVNYELSKNNFTQLSCTEISKVSGKYSKLIYWYLRRYSDIGVWSCDYKTFRSVLNIPENYNNTRVHKRIIIPSVKQLREYYPGLTCYERRGKRDKVEYVVFVFDAKPKKRTNINKRNNLLEKMYSKEEGRHWVEITENGAVPIVFEKEPSIEDETVFEESTFSDEMYDYTFEMPF